MKNDIVISEEQQLLDFIDNNIYKFDARVGRELMKIARIINGKNRDDANIPYWVQCNSVQWMLYGIILAMRGVGVKDAKPLAVNTAGKCLKFPKGRVYVNSSGLRTKDALFLAWLLSRYAERLWNELPQEDKNFCYHVCTRAYWQGKYTAELGLKSIGGDIIERCLNKYKLARQLCNQLTQNLC